MKIAIKSVLRLPNYWSDGIIVFNDEEKENINMRGIFTIDKFIGNYNGKFIDCNMLLKNEFDEAGNYKINGKSFKIPVDFQKLYIPEMYPFLLDGRFASLELASVIKDKRLINEVEKKFSNK